MSESAVGVIVTNTRQNASGAKKGAVLAEMVRVAVTVASSGSVRPRRRSHELIAFTSWETASSATRVGPAAAAKTHRRTDTRTRRTAIEDSLRMSLATAGLSA